MLGALAALVPAAVEAGFSELTASPTRPSSPITAPEATAKLMRRERDIIFLLLLQLKNRTALNRSTDRMKTLGWRFGDVVKFWATVACNTHESKRKNRSNARSAGKASGGRNRLLHQARLARAEVVAGADNSEVTLTHH